MQVLRTGRLNESAECWKALPLSALAPSLARGHPAFRGAGGPDTLPLLVPPPIYRAHHARVDLLETLHSASSADAETPRDNLEPEPEPEPKPDAAQLRLSMRKMVPEKPDFTNKSMTFLHCELMRTLGSDLPELGPCYAEGWSCSCCQKTVHAKPAVAPAVTRTRVMRLCLALARHLMLLDEMEEIECRMGSGRPEFCPAMVRTRIAAH
jgi:hypothetical protein